MKSINHKLNKLTFINDEEKHDDVNLRRLVANSLKIELEDTGYILFEIINTVISKINIFQANKLRNKKCSDELY